MNKLLRYAAQVAIIYLVFRYFSSTRMSALEALLTSLAILAIYIVIENLCYQAVATVNTESLLERFSQPKCTNCGVEGFEGTTENSASGMMSVTGGTSADVTITNNSVNPPPPSPAAPMQAPPAPTAVAKGGVVPDGVKMPHTENVANTDMKPRPRMMPPKCRMVCDDGSPPLDSFGFPRKPNPASGVDEIPNVDLQVKAQSVTGNDDRFYWGSRYGRHDYDDRYGFGGMYYDEYPFYNRNNKNTTIPPSSDEYGLSDRERAMRARAAWDGMDAAVDRQAHTTSGYRTPYMEGGSMSMNDGTHINRRSIEGELDNELPYSDYNHLPVAAGYKSHDYEYGYNFLPPEKWFPTPTRPPVCVTEKRSPIMPSLTNGAPVDVKEFHSSRRITPPDMINVNIINDKLNAGR